MSRTTYTKGAVLLLAVLVLVVEGYLAYGYYNRYYSEGDASGELNSSTALGASTTANNPSGTTAKQEEDRTRTALIHRSTPGNIVDNSTYIDDPSTNGNPDAVLLVTPYRERGGGVTNAHPIGVWYDANRGGKWAIFNQDLAPMPEDAVFSVVVQKVGETAFVHHARPANTTNKATYLDHPLANGNPEAILSVTPNWNPGGGTGFYNDHLIEVRYNPGEKKWAVINQDAAPITRNAAFNVAVW